MDINNFKKLPIMGILRGIDRPILPILTEAIISSGLRTVEITMNTANAHLLIRDMLKLSGNKLTVGAGTVLSKEDMDIALDNGASFIVLPALIEDVVDKCVKKNVPVFPGALTPKEVYEAWAAGAAMVKVFPAKLFGPGYFKELKGPFDCVELLACGGVTPSNLKEFFLNGAQAVSFGASVFRKEYLNKDKIGFIENGIKDFIDSYKKYLE